MFGPLALILAAAGAFVGLVVLRSVSRLHPDHDQVRGFALVGSIAVIVFAVVVVITGLVAPFAAMAESLALLVMFGLQLYLLVAVVVIMVARRLPAADRIRSAVAYQAPDGEPGGDGPGQPADHARADQP